MGSINELKNLQKQIKSLIQNAKSEHNYLKNETTGIKLEISEYLIQGLQEAKCEYQIEAIDKFLYTLQYWDKIIEKEIEKKYKQCREVVWFAIYSTCIIRAKNDKDIRRLCEEKYDTTKEKPKSSRSHD